MSIEHTEKLTDGLYAKPVFVSNPCKNELTTEPSLDPPVTPEDRKDEAEYRIYKNLPKRIRDGLMNIEHFLKEADEEELLLQQQAMQAEDDDLDYQMHMDEMPVEYRSET